MSRKEERQESDEHCRGMPGGSGLTRSVTEGVMFDYIIVGAGSAGCVLASRLTEDPACRVLLLEAGGEDDAPAIRIPALYGRLQDSPCDWADRTVPQTHLNGRRLFVPQGRVLGGSSFDQLHDLHPWKSR